MNKKREVYSDVLKIISIFMVILIHIISIYRGRYFSSTSIFFLLLSIIDSFTRVAVPIFFMITGTFMLQKKTDKYSTYFKKRVLKLLIPLLITSIFYYLYGNIRWGSYISVINFIRNFTNDTVQYHLWFMYVIIILYMLIPYLQVLVQNLDNKKLLNLIILLTILANGFNTIFLFSNHYGHSILEGFMLPSMFAYINYLFIGYYLSKNKLSKKNKIILSILAIISMCSMIIANRLYATTGIDDEMILATSIFPILPSVVVYVLVKDFFDNKKVSKLFTLITSKISSCILYLYLVHAFFLDRIEKDLLKNWVCKNHFEEILRIILVSIAVFIISFGVAYLIVVVQNLIKKLIQKKQEKN